MPKAYNLPERLILEEQRRIKEGNVVKRIWSNDHTVWKESSEEIENRLGWLNSHIIMADKIKEIVDFSTQVRDEGYQSILLLGMGGSSLAPEVFRLIFGVKKGYPDLQVLDSTDPGAILDKERKIDLRKTIFIVSTKSGGTVETISLMKYFYNKIKAQSGREAAGRQFVAITDPGSGLENRARKLGFKKIFLNDPNIGGRYSALSYFGLVPAGLTGIDLSLLLESATAISERAKIEEVSESANNPAWLGLILGALGKAGRDKVTLIAPPETAPLGAWIEQLLAESTGKEGKGLLPVDGESIAPPEVYANDRLFIQFSLKDEGASERDVEALIEAGHPVIRLDLKDRHDTGGEMFRWMFATAIAGWSLKINPFDQPNVEDAKVQARKMVEEYREMGRLPNPDKDLNTEGIEVYSGFKKKDFKSTWREFFTGLQPGDNEGRGRSYISIQAYLQPSPENDRALQELRTKLQNLYRVAVTVGYGPRFLHSTGQLHKGDDGKGLFIQITARSPEDIPIPDEPGSDNSSINFGVLIRAQALGDRRALLDAGRKVITYHLKIKPKKALDKLTEAL